MIKYFCTKEHCMFRIYVNENKRICPFKNCIYTINYQIVRKIGDEEENGTKRTDGTDCDDYEE